MSFKNPVAIIVGLTLLTIACQPQTSTERIRTAVSILPQVEFVEAVGGDKIEPPLLMVPPGANPHTHEPRPSQMSDLSRVQLYFRVGADLEFELAWMDKLIDINRSMVVVDGSEGIELMEEEVGLADPHYWMSPPDAAKTVRNITEGLASFDTANRAYYERNRDAYLDKLEKLDRDIRERFSGLTRRTFIVYHPVLAYFAEEYNLTEVAIEEEGKEPSAAHLAEVITLAKDNNIKHIFATPQFNPRNAEIVAGEIGGEVIAIDDLAGDYIENMYRILDYLVEALK